MRNDVSLIELLQLQDVAKVEGDLAWQMAEFRRAETGAPARGGGGSGALSPAQQASKAKLTAELRPVEPGALRNAVAVAKQQQTAAKATPVRVGRRGEHGD